MDSDKVLLADIEDALATGAITKRDLMEIITGRQDVRILAEILHTILCNRGHIEKPEYAANCVIDACAFYGENSATDPWKYIFHKRWIEVAKYLVEVSGRSPMNLIDDIKEHKTYMDPTMETNWIVGFYSTFKIGAVMAKHVANVIRILNPMLVQISDKGDKYDE